LPRTLSKLLPLVVLLAVVFVGWTHVDALVDWFKLRGYTPPAAVLTLATQDTMTPAAKHIFYVNHPALVSSATDFRQDCPENEQTIVLGCYQSGESGIFVYSVSDPRLDGVQEVTAAHEMLHAAYERLSSKDRTQVDALLEAYYKNDLKAQRIIATINAYKKTEPNDVVNEMHSVFGTEVGNLPAPLEKYYTRYFANRAAVVGFAQNYQNEFTTRITQVNAYDAQLADLKSEISAKEQSLSNQLSQINTDRARLDSYKAAGDYTSYNSAVPGFNGEVDNYNAGVSQLQYLIAQYNQLVTTRNSVASELRALDQSIDTRLTTLSAQ